MTIEVRERTERLGRYVGTLGWTEFELAYSAHVPMTDTAADLAMVVDAEEHQRRMLAEAGAIGDDREAFITLCTLPQNEPIRLADLDHHDRGILKRLPRGFVDIQDGTVKRLARPAVHSVLAVVYDDQWERGLNRASSFAPFGTRVLALTTTEGNDLELAATEASLYGIGLVVVHTDEQDDQRVAPQLWVETRPGGPVGWRFQDQAYTAWRQQNHCHPTIQTGRSPRR